MKADYYIMNPSGNITALVHGSVPEELYGAAAAKIARLHPETEQTGFIPDDDIFRLNMAGGEFCGNATLSAAAFLAGVLLVPEGEKKHIAIKVSGEENPVDVTVIPRPGRVYECGAVMPDCKRIITRDFEIDGRVYSLPAVEFSGITHLIYCGAPDDFPAEKAVKKWCADCGAKCLGIMFLSPAENKLTPLVYSPGAGTLCWESSCASGTTAAGIYLAEKSGREVDITFTEPRGSLRIKAGGGRPPVLCGRVTCEKTDSIEI